MLELTRRRTCELQERLDPSELGVRGRQRKPAEARSEFASSAVKFDVTTLKEVAHRDHRDVARLSDGMRRLQLRANRSNAFTGLYGKLVDSIKGSMT